MSLVLAARRIQRPGGFPGNAPAARRTLAGLLAVVLLGACSTSFLYNRIDWVVSWYVNGLVSLDNAQERQLREVTRRTLQWQKQTQFPLYIVLLDQMALQSSAPVTAEQLDERYQQVAVLLDDFLREVTPGVADLLRTLRTDQIQELAASLAEDNEELWEDFAGDTPESRRKQRKKSALRAIQRFVGRLSLEQRALVELRLSSMNDVSEQWLERRTHWQERFLSILSNPADGGLFESLLLDLVLDPNQFDSGDYRQQVEGNRQLVFAMIAELSGTLTAGQRDHLRRTFANYADDLRKIAAD